jgi:hypothetical protein
MIYGIMSCAATVTQHMSRHPEYCPERFRTAMATHEYVDDDERAHAVDAARREDGSQGAAALKSLNVDYKFDAWGRIEVGKHCIISKSDIAKVLGIDTSVFWGRYKLNHKLSKRYYLRNDDRFVEFVEVDADHVRPEIGDYWNDL